MSKNSKTPNFWEQKSLDQLTQEEWELLCDKCGLCCLHKLEDEDSGDIFYTCVACRLLNIETCQCTFYADRFDLVENCIDLYNEDRELLSMMPPTCAYRLIYEGKKLGPWHHLISNDENSVHQEGISVQGKALAEEDVDLEELEEYVIYVTPKKLD